MSLRTATGQALFVQAASLRRVLGSLVLLAACAMTALIPLAQAATDHAADQPVVEQLLEAIARKDYQAFIGQGTPDFAQLEEPQFDQVANAVAPRLQQGYSVQYLGNLRQQGLEISVWKISFQDQGDDLLATLNVSNSKVGGFFLR